MEQEFIDNIAKMANQCKTYEQLKKLRRSLTKEQARRVINSQCLPLLDRVTMSLMMTFEGDRIDPNEVYPDSPRDSKIDKRPKP